MSPVGLRSNRLNSGAVATMRRPEVIVRVTRAGAPVADAYVYAVPVKGTVCAPFGMRTDRDGTAWFQLRDPGRYVFTCPAGGSGAQTELDCPLQPLDLTKGGLGPLLTADLLLAEHAPAGSGGAAVTPSATDVRLKSAAACCDCSRPNSDVSLACQHPYASQGDRLATIVKPK